MRWHKSKLIMSLPEKGFREKVLERTKWFELVYNFITLKKGLSVISMFYDFLKKRSLVLDARMQKGKEKSLRETSLFLT